MTWLSTSEPLRDYESGFTFVGVLLLVMALALFVSALFLAIPPSESTRQVQLTMLRADLLQGAIRKYKLQNANSAPASLSNLVISTGTPCTVDTNSTHSTYRSLQGWCGPYLDLPIASAPNEFQTDGWGVLFSYNGINLISCGPNRVCGDSDDLTFNNF